LADILGAHGRDGGCQPLGDGRQFRVLRHGFPHGGLPRFIQLAEDELQQFVAGQFVIVHG